MPIKQIVTTNGGLEYEISSSFAYRFSRYLILDLVTKSEQYKSGEIFHLLPMIKKITDEYLTDNEKQATYLRKNGTPESVFDAIRWYVPFIGRDTKVLERVKPGWYQMPTGITSTDNNTEEIEKEIEEEIAEENGKNPVGWLYAFTFPELIKDGAYPIKVGMTIRDAEERIADQCKGSAIFSKPEILKVWEVRNVSLTERTVQNLLKLSGKWKLDAPGQEWFITTLSEIDRIVNIVKNETI